MSEPDYKAQEEAAADIINAPYHRARIAALEARIRDLEAHDLRDASIQQRLQKALCEAHCHSMWTPWWQRTADAISLVAVETRGEPCTGEER